MSGYTLRDFGGCFLTTDGPSVDNKQYPGVCAYVEWFIPENARELAITFVHGGGGQGSEFLRTPDNRPGWVHAFLAAGYPVYVLDRPGHGRCHWNESVLGPSMGVPNYELLYPRFVEPAKHELWKEASLHSQWPGDPQCGDRFMASQGVMATTLEAAQRHAEAIADQLFKLTGPTVILSHSAGGPCGWALAAVGGDSVAAIVAVEPLGYPGQEHLLGCFDNGLAAASFAGEFNPYERPVLLVTGEATWMREANAKTAEFLVAQGYGAEHILLEERGITGNGHMMMSELNSDKIAGFLVNWLDEL
ncbi:alpha/beta hydrolase [Dasania marina]|uniref:alpha/beta hydrolase n=1 Tax=Dasania marina TaxID=471499 RepID=UPI0030D7EDCB|tara:strand:- start:8296 stop:9207 length:912 start_codon:yes stop_codon:yes gene_type:complete